MTRPHTNGAASLPLEAEASVLCALLIGDRRHADALMRVSSTLEPSAFTDARHRVLFEAMSRLRRLGEDIDPTILSEELRRRGAYEKAGGFDYIADILDVHASPDMAESYARIIQEHAQRRRWRALLGASLRDLDEADGPSLEELMASHAERVDGLRATAGGAVRTISLREVLENPGAHGPPPEILHRLAWRGRTTLLAAREKLGKSTLCTAAAAARSAGLGFLGQGTDAGTVLWVGLEEHRDDTGQRMDTFGASWDRTHLLERVVAPLVDLEQAVIEHGPDVVFIDTLAAFTEAMELDPGSATAWTPIMSRLGRIARDYDTALVILHHARKSDGAYRDSSAIGAGVDMILEMSEGQTEGVRKIKARGRWKLEDYSVQMVEATERGRAFFSLVTQELGLDAQILAFLARHPGASSRSVRDQVRGRTQEITDAIHRLIESRAIEDRGTGRNLSLFIREEKPHGTAPEPVGNHSGTGSRNHGAEVVPAGGSPPVGGSPREPHPETAVGM